MTSPVSVTIRGDIAWVEIDNPPVNATSTAVRAGLVDAVSAVEQSGARAAILVCAGRTFVAGGDMSEFDAPPVEPHLPDAVALIESCRVPWIAALHGTVLGGGFEIAMGCAWRIAAAGTRLGLPEVSVGLIPGAGGTQRLPRLVPMPFAIDIACRGKIVTAEAMLAAGGIDQIVESDLREAAQAFSETLPSRPKAVGARTTPAIDPALIETERNALHARARGQQSPLHVLEALQWAALPFAEGQPKERARHLELRDSAESRALRHAFFAERKVAKPTVIAGTEPQDLTRIAIVGGGLMGAGIATAALNAGYPVTVIEQNADAVDAARERVTGNLDGALKRGKIDATTYDTRKAALTVSDTYDAVTGHDLAIEAVFEDIAVKRAVFQRLAAALPDTAILATNTSYLDPAAIFEGIPAPDRCIGLHFFSPAHIMKLLEIVRMPETSAQTLGTAFGFARRLGKVGVLAGVCDGFIGNRMLAAYRRQAEYMLADGALPQQIDRAMRGFGYAMGPFEAQDMSGLQIAWANRKAQAATRGPAQRYVTIADRLCEQGRLGQRSGKGWYDYPDGTRKPQPSAEVGAIIAEGAQGSGQTFSDEDITGHLLAVLANEGRLIVAEDIAEDAEAVDMVQVHGYGFPRWRGGPLRYADEIGLDRTRRSMNAVAAQSPGAWKIAEEYETRN